MTYWQIDVVAPDVVLENRGWRRGLRPAYTAWVGVLFPKCPVGRADAGFVLSNALAEQVWVDVYRLDGTINTGYGEGLLALQAAGDFTVADQSCSAQFRWEDAPAKQPSSLFSIATAISWPLRRGETQT